MQGQVGKHQGGVVGGGVAGRGEHDPEPLLGFPGKEWVTQGRQV